MTANPIWGEDWPEVRRHWLLDPDVAHCNHGSFGAVPGPTLAVQNEFRDRMAANPMRWFAREMPPLVAEARGEAARFLEAEPDDVAFVPNVSAAVSTVLQSLTLSPGDEVLRTDHAYGSVTLAVERLCARTGAECVVAEVPADASAEQIVAQVAARCSGRTRLVVIDHVTSGTARRFPVEAIAAVAHEAGALVLVDGAHAPAMLPLDIPALGVDFWTGNLHKWPCAPAGTAALWVAARHRDLIRPLIVSHGEHEGFPAAFDQVGTNDLSAWLAAPVSLRLLGSFGWDRVRKHNETLVTWAQRMLAEELGVPLGELHHDAGLSLALVPLPAGRADTREAARDLQRAMIPRGVEMQVVHRSGRSAIRLSAHVYNSPADYERMAAGVRDLLFG